MVNKQKNYTELKLELDNILSELQKEETNLEEAVILYEQGLKVANMLKSYLEKNVIRVKDISGIE